MTFQYFQNFLMQMNPVICQTQTQAHQRKMQFNPDHSKQSKEVIFSKKSKYISYPPASFYNNEIKKMPQQKHVGVVLDSKLNFNNHIDHKIQIKKCNELIELIKRLSTSLPKSDLLTIYKSFGRCHLDFGHILHDKPRNQNFKNKIEKRQYRAFLS